MLSPLQYFNEEPDRKKALGSVGKANLKWRIQHKPLTVTFQVLLLKLTKITEEEK